MYYNYTYENEYNCFYGFTTFIDPIGSWIDGMVCIDEYLRAYFRLSTKWDLSFAKELCAEACYNAKDCLAADLSKGPAFYTGDKARYHCYLSGKTCNQNRLLEYREQGYSYYHFKKGKSIPSLFNFNQ